MKRSILVAAATFAALTVAAPAAHAQPLLRGPWKITFCSNPDKPCDVSQCLQFTRSAGLVNGMPQSGTWTIPSFGLSGQWVQYGDTVQLLGRYTIGGISAGIAFTGILNGARRIGGVSFFDAFDDFSSSNTGTWIGEKTAQCAATAPARQLNGLLSESPGE